MGLIIIIHYIILLRGEASSCSGNDYDQQIFFLADDVFNN